MELSQRPIVKCLVFTAVTGREREQGTEDLTREEMIGKGRRRRTWGCGHNSKVHAIFPAGEDMFDSGLT